jgi:hypothetical protein
MSIRLGEAQIDALRTMLNDPMISLATPAIELAQTNDGTLVATEINNNSRPFRFHYISQGGRVKIKAQDY